MEGKEIKKEKKDGDQLHITDANFNDILQEYTIALIDFWADWCGPCKALAPTIEKLAEDYHDKVLVGKLDVDKNPLTADRFKVSSIPTVLIFKKGKKVGRIVGYVPKSRIEAALNKILDEKAERAKERRCNG